MCGKTSLYVAWEIKRWVMSAKYIVEHSLEGRIPHAVRGCETIEDLREYLDTDPHSLYRLVSCRWDGGTYTLVWEIINDGRTALLEACKRTYRKHFLNDPTIGWEKLIDEVHDALIEGMGIEEFNDWVDKISEGKNNI
jgi:hypothetical protein